MTYIVPCLSRTPSGITEERENQLSELWRRGEASGGGSYLIDLDEQFDGGYRYKFLNAGVSGTAGGLWATFRDSIDEVIYFSVIPNNISQVFYKLVKDNGARKFDELQSIDIDYLESNILPERTVSQSEGLGIDSLRYLVGLIKSGDYERFRIVINPFLFTETLSHMSEIDYVSNKKAFGLRILVSEKVPMDSVYIFDPEDQSNDAFVGKVILVSRGETK